MRGNPQRQTLKMAEEVDQAKLAAKAGYALLGDGHDVTRQHRHHPWRHGGRDRTTTMPPGLAGREEQPATEQRLQNAHGCWRCAP